MFKIVNLKCFDHLLPARYMVKYSNWYDVSTLNLITSLNESLLTNWSEENKQAAKNYE